LHNCEVKDYAVIGLGSRICGYAIVGFWSIVGEGAVVTCRSDIPDGKICVGMPAKVLRDVTEEDKKIWSFLQTKISELRERYKKGLNRLS